MVLFETKVVCGAMRPFSTKIQSRMTRPSKLVAPPKCIQLNHIQKNTRKYSWFSLPTLLLVCFLVGLSSDLRSNGKSFSQGSNFLKSLKPRSHAPFRNGCLTSQVDQSWTNIAPQSYIYIYIHNHTCKYIYIYNIMIYIYIYIVPPQDLHFNQISH